MMKRFLSHPRNAIALMLALIVMAALTFLLVGIKLNQEADTHIKKLAGTPGQSLSPTGGLVSFAKLIDATLDPSTIESYVRDVPEPHGLGLFNGKLYASSWRQQRIYRVDVTDGTRKTLTDEVNGAHDMVLDANGQIVTPLFKENRLVKIDPSSGKVSPFVSGLSGPNGIAKSRDGGFYVTNATSGTVVKISQNGQVKTVVSGLKQPAGILSDSDNILWVAQYDDPENSVIEIQDNGKRTTVVRGLAGAESLLRDDERNVIIGHVIAGRAALSIFPRGKQVKTLLQTSLPGPMVGPVTDGKFLYFESPESGQSTVYRIAWPT